MCYSSASAAFTFIKLASIQPQVFILAWQIRDFIDTGHQYQSIISTETREVVDFITKGTLRPPQPASTSSSSRSRSQSPNQPRQTWPLDWAIDRPKLRLALKAFQHSTQKLHLPPSTGNTPPDLVEQSSSSTANPDPSNTANPDPSPETRNTSVSADEAIYSHPIGPELPPPNDMATGFSTAQRAELRAELQAILAELRAQGPATTASGSGAGNGGNGANPATGTGVIAGPAKERFNPDDVGFFDPFYDSKSADTGPAIEHAGKSTYFRDIHVFIDRVKDVARAKGEEIIRSNLQICLRGSALGWFTTELTENDKRLLTYNIEEWYRVLLSRWKAPKTQGMSILLREKYSLQDASRRREPREFAQTILRAGQTAELGTIKDHMLLIWNGLDFEFQRDIPEPDSRTDYNHFLESLDRRKYQWWEHASRHSKSQNLAHQNHQPQHRKQDNRPENQQRGYQFRQPQPYQSQPSTANTYQYSQQSNRPFQNANPAQNYQGNRSQNYPSQQPNQRPPLPSQTTRLQLTAAPGAGNGSGSRNDRPFYQPNSQQQNSYRPPFRPSNGPYQGNRFQNQSQRAYQAGVEEIDEPEYEQIDYGNQNSEAYSGHVAEQAHENETDPSHESQEEAYQVDDATEGYFSQAAPTPDFQCNHCQMKCTSRNKLFSHLREKCWQKKHPSSQSFPIEKSMPAVFSEHPSAEIPASKSDFSALNKDLDEPEKPQDPIIIRSVSEACPGNGNAFRNYHYAVTEITWDPKGDKKQTCADAGCTMTMADSSFIPAGTKLRKMDARIPIRGLGSKLHFSDEFAVLKFYMHGTLPDGVACMAEITREIHVVSDLKAGMLIGSDILTPERMVIDFASQTIRIGSCKNMIIPMNSRARSSPIKRAIHASFRTILPARSTTSVPIAFAGELPRDRDFLFEPKCDLELGIGGGAFAHMADSSFTSIQIKNDSEKDVILPLKTRIGTLGEFDQDGYFLINAFHADLAATGWRNWKSKAARDAISSLSLHSDSTTPITESIKTITSFTSHSDSAFSKTDSITIDPTLEKVMPNGVTIYGDSHASNRLGQLIDQYQDLFIDQGSTVDIPEEEWMPIPLKPGVTSKPAKVYPVGQKDKEVIDATFDKLQEQGKMYWSKQPTPFSYPVFVVWKDTQNGRKGRVVVDIRELNKITENDTYPLPLQSEIIALLLGYQYLSTIDAVGWFHQFLVSRNDRHKFTVVSHRGQEESAVALMGYKGSPPYVQRQTDAMLRPFKEFAKAFVDDIIIFSRTLSDHINHLTRVFNLFRVRRVSLSPTKSYIGYPSVTLLGQRVDGLGMSTSKEKIQAISALKFPDTLRDLEIFLGLTGWLRSSIPCYAQLANALQERKTTLTKGLAAGNKSSGPARKRAATRVLFYEPTQAELDSFTHLKEAFSAPSFLSHYDSNRPLFIDLDASKVFGFAAIIYHLKSDKIAENSSNNSAKKIAENSPSNNASKGAQKTARTDVQPIMFLSRSLNTAEHNYWPTELEIAGIVWVVKKVRHMVEANKQPTIIYTDHAAAIPISKQTNLTTSSTDKLNLRLIRASQYLSAFTLDIRHKPGKSNTVPDALSRLQQDPRPIPKHTEGELDALHVSAHACAYNATLVEMTSDFRARLQASYVRDPQWHRLLVMLQAKEEQEKGDNSQQLQPEKAVEIDQEKGDNFQQLQPEKAMEKSDTKVMEFNEKSEARSDEKYLEIAADSGDKRQRIPGIPFALKDGLIYQVNGHGIWRLCIPGEME